ncbi:PPE domain-containing protein [Rhodococcus maanshanensis]|uniref:PPE family protein n=1 Tax=Rhodococcus maanshanensis TaxID=183556 RepID=A0A1H7J6D9_9NOCA|nr:PPE domain-containing protein [Rhodococcus maanshanensis]SEK69550.1 PPE family protein [Rhodococcus maanshanensis]
MSFLPSLDELKGSMGDLASGALDDLSDLTRDPGNKIIDVVSGYDIAEGNRVEDRQEAGNAERSALYGRQDGLRAEFGGGYEPPSVVPDSFDSMSHEAIKSAVDAMSADPIRASAEGWAKIGSSLGEGLAEFNQFISNEITGKWEGVAADAAVAATAAYVADSDELAVAGRLVGTKVAEAATGISQVKATMPAVEATSALESLVNVALPSVGMVKQLVHGSDEARQQAIQIMKTVYMPVIQQADTNVPIFPRPGDHTPPPHLTPDSTSGGPGIGGPSGYNPSGYTGPGDAPVAPTRQGVGNDPAAGSPGADPSDPNAGANPLSPDGSGADGSNSPFAQTDPSSAWTAPAAAGGADGTGSGPGTGTGTGSGAGTGSGGHGAAGSASGLAAGGGSGASYGAGGGLGTAGGLGGAGRGPGGGMGMPGAAGGAPGAGGAGGGAAGAAGRPGAMGGGMAPGGARANGDDDTEHKTPSYLVNVDNGNELVGRLPKVAPPVIGG